MAKDRKTGPKVLVTEAATGSAVTIIRSLGRKGWHVIAADSNPRSAGFHSRYTQEQLLYPSAEAAPRELVTTLVHAARERKVDLIIPLYDPVLLPLSEFRACFEGVCQVALADKDSLDVVRDKSKTLELARRLGVPVPQSRRVHNRKEAGEAARTFGWPLVLKPEESFDYRPTGGCQYMRVCYAADEQELTERMEAFEGRCPVLAQEHCRGVGYGVELLAHKGRPLAVFQHKRLRELPITGGISTFRESVALDPTLYGYATRLLKELNWTGLAMVEFKIGANGPKLMEVNGRVWGSLPLAVRSGVDFPAHLANLYHHGPPDREVDPVRNYKIGVRVRNLELDLSWINQALRGKHQSAFLNAPTRREGLGALLGLLNPRYKYDILSLSDPGPAWVEVSRIISTRLKKWRKPISARRCLDWITTS
jgi:predicted ATP-grasp superfamily ATP-dependent carboligase